MAEPTMADVIRDSIALANAKEQIAQALVELDRVAEKVLLTQLSSSMADHVNALHELDETRGRIWATHNAASDVLKAAERSSLDADHG